MDSDSDIEYGLLEKKESRTYKLVESCGFHCFLNTLVVLIIAGVLIGVIYAIATK